MKRFLVFRIEEYYPAGGMNDLEGDFDTLEEARDFAKKLEEKKGNFERYDVDIFDLVDKRHIK